MVFPVPPIKFARTLSIFLVHNTPQHCLLVEGNLLRVEGKWSRVEASRESKNSSQLFLNIVKSKFRVYLSFWFPFYFTLTPRLSEKSFVYNGRFVA